jgi:nitronate monooxygenase
MTPARISEVVQEIRSLTSSPFAVNLWVSTEDPGAFSQADRAFARAIKAVAGFFRELDLEPPVLPLSRWPAFDEQAAALLEARPPVFSFIFGVPPATVLEECGRHGIVTVGTATTVEEAVALEQAGVDLVVASGAEAGGHRPSFLRPADMSVTGTMSLVPRVADAVEVPVIAAGGIADGRGVAAALALGADAVQIGTAFLACEESNATPAHREALFSPRAGDTMLTRAFTGRLARGLRNGLAETLDEQDTPLLPYPLQGQLIGALREEALRRGRLDLVAFWSGQSAPLLRHRHAAELFQDLVESTGRILSQSGFVSA